MEDSINRNLMIEVFEQELKYQQTEVVHCGSNYKELEGIEKALKWCIDKLKSCPKMNKWIPVSKRLPKKDETEVLITIKEDGSVLQATYLDDRTFDTEAYGWFAIKDIAAWMPLPQPYKEGEE